MSPACIIGSPFCCRCSLHRWCEAVEFVDHSTNGSGKIAAGKITGITDPPALDPRQLPQARDSSADQPGEILQRSGKPPGSVGDHHQADQIGLRDKPGGPLPRGSLRRPQSPKM
jgi:hypothetical protein